MSSIFQTIFGGSNQQSSNSSSNQSSSNSGNLAYPFLAGMLGPSVGALPNGTNMVGSLLGLPNYTPTSAPAIPAGVPSPQPPVSTTPAVSSLHHVDLFHDGINGNGRAAQRAGQPTNYWADASGQPFNIATPNPQGSLATTPLGILNRGMLRNGDPRPVAPVAPVAPTTPVAPTVPKVPGVTILPDGTHVGTVVDRPNPSVPTVNGTTPGTGTGAGAGTSTPTSSNPSLDALNTFANSAGLKFLQDQGNQMINNNQAAKGMLQSGSTLKGLQDYANNLNSTYLNQYLDHLFDFGKLGLGAAGILSDAGRYSNGLSLGSSSGTGSGSSKPGLITSSNLGSLLAMAGA